MNTQHHMEERLWNYIDGLAPSDEQSVIARLVENDAAWKAKYHELLEISNLLHQSTLEAPSLRFTRNVMEEIARQQIAPAAKKYINQKIIWGLSLFFITILAGFLIYGFGQTDWSQSSGNSTLSKQLNNIKGIDFSQFFNNTWMNVLIMINVVLGLFLLDNYLGNKRKQYRGES